jgi:DNA-directed RNA polymerase beta subunit
VRESVRDEFQFEMRQLGASHCGQRPLVSTRYAKYFGVDTLTYGVNAIVAIATAGYNQEDSIIMNRARSTWSVQQHHFHTIIEDENDDEENGFSEYFFNPIDRSVTVKSGSVMSLDAHGLPRIGSHPSWCRTHWKVSIGRFSSWWSRRRGRVSHR